MIEGVDRYISDAEHHLARGEASSALAYVRSALAELKQHKPTLKQTIEDYLRNLGYVEFEPDVWGPPDGEWTDKLIPTIVDCLEMEHEDA